MSYPIDFYTNHPEDAAAFEQEFNDWLEDQPDPRDFADEPPPRAIPAEEWGTSRPSYPIDEDIPF